MIWPFIEWHSFSTTLKPSQYRLH